MAFIFYDTETTGLSAGFDQILQFAALVTDDDLNVVEEVNLRCRPQSHVLLSPGALKITGMRPSEVVSAPQSHYEMVKEIRALILRHAPAIMVGYNSLGYDEGMLRQAFYQTLHPVYLTNTGGNARMDMLRLAHAASHYAPGVLTIPTNEKGRPSFKLERLANANGLLHDQAHDALSDTRATLELARLVRTKAPGVWNAMHHLRSKQLAAEYVDSNELFHYTNPSYGTPTILAARIAANVDNPAEVAVFDLAHDPTPFLDKDIDGVLAMLKASPRRIRVVKLNGQPILMPLSIPPVGIDAPDLEVARQRAKAITNHPTFGENVSKAMAARYAERPVIEHVEQRIYDGFPSRADANLMERFHTAPWEERQRIVECLSDTRYRELGERLIYLERPDVLSANNKQRWDGWRKDRLTHPGDVPWGTLTSVIAEIAEIEGSGSTEMAALLSECKWYVAAMRQELGADHAEDAPESERVLTPGHDAGLCVRSSDWKTEPMPSECKVVPIDLRFSLAEMSKIRRGFKPQDMDDRWFAYVEDETLYLHRSWSGYCVYEVNFTDDDGYAEADQFTVNRNTEQYTCTDDAEDAENVVQLIRTLFLNR